MGMEETEFERDTEFEGGFAGENEYEDEYEQAENEAASEIMRMSSESELDHFLPLLIGPLLTGLKALAPMVMKAAVPMLKTIGSQALASVVGGPPQQEEFPYRRRRRGRGRGGEEEQENEWGWRHRHHRFWGGRPWYWNRDRWLPRPQPAEGDEEQEQFLGIGKLLGGLLGESESEQEDFLLGKLLGGLMGEVDGLDMDNARFTTARWIVRLARHVARVAAASVLARKQSGVPIGGAAVRRIVFDAVLGAARQHPHHADSRHLGHQGHGQAPHAAASGRWVRRGSRIVVHL